MKIQEIDANTACEWLKDGSAILIDVREEGEYQVQNIDGAVLCPLGTVCCDALPDLNGKIIIHCKKGVRGAKACKILLKENNELELYNLTGGIDAWHACGLPTNSS